MRIQVFLGLSGPYDSDACTWVIYIGLVEECNNFSRTLFLLFTFLSFSVVFSHNESFAFFCGSLKEQVNCSMVPQSMVLH